MQNDANKIFFEKIRKLRSEADRVLFSDGGKHWPIFRIKVIHISLIFYLIQQLKSYLTLFRMSYTLIFGHFLKNI